MDTGNILKLPRRYKYEEKSLFIWNNYFVVGVYVCVRTCGRAYLVAELTLNLLAPTKVGARINP